jgi:hypothetical protein
MEKYIFTYKARKELIDILRETFKSEPGIYVL